MLRDDYLARIKSKHYSFGGLTNGHRNQVGVDRARLRDGLLWRIPVWSMVGNTRPASRRLARQLQTMKGMAMAEGNVKTVAVVTDNTSDMCDQALYLDGVLQMADSTIYACDIAKHGGGDPICFRHFIIDLPEGHQWPQSLGEALQFEQTTENTGVASSG